MKRPAIGYESATPSVLLRDNVASTAATCDAAIAAGASRFVFSSSAFAMGYSHAAIGPHAWCPRYLPVDELHGAMPMETYGLSKLLGEEVLESAARTATSTSFVSLRFTNIVKRERWSSLPWPAPSAAEPMPLILWAYTHEDDVIEAHVAAVTRPEAARPTSHDLARYCHTGGPLGRAEAGAWPADPDRSRLAPRRGPSFRRKVTAEGSR
jgi:nucleoside-diphosphate-sugar epimerase